MTEKKQNLKVDVHIESFTGHIIWKNTYPLAGTTRQEEPQTNATMIFVVKGDIMLLRSNLKDNTIPAGEFTLIPPGQAYSLKVMADAHIMYCIFNTQMLFAAHNQYQAFLCAGKSTIKKHNQLVIKQILSAYLSLMVDYILADINPQSFIELKTQELFYLLFRCYNKQELAEFLHLVSCKEPESGNLQSWTSFLETSGLNQNSFLLKSKSVIKGKKQEETNIFDR